MGASAGRFTVVPTRALLRVSEGLDLKAACTIPVQGLTAHYLIHDAHRGAVQPGDWMLIHAAAGGTGQIAVQLAKRAGYNVIGSASSAKLELCHSIGCDAVIDYGNEDVAARVMEITGGVGASAVLDGVGKSTCVNVSAFRGAHPLITIHLPGTKRALPRWHAVESAFSLVTPAGRSRRLRLLSSWLNPRSSRGPSSTTTRQHEKSWTIGRTTFSQRSPTEILRSRLTPPFLSTMCRRLTATWKQVELQERCF